MSRFDLLIRGGTLVAPGGLLRADLGVNEGRIEALGPELAGAAREEMRADGLHIFPGVIDAHVHFNEPGRTHWEGFETGSRSLAAGGGTLCFDMPLNAHPPTLDARSFRLKADAAAATSLVDFALWGGLVPGNLDRLDELAGCGVVGFKAFMTNSGIDDFPCVDDRTLREGMKRASRLRLPIAVHAENEALIHRLARERLEAGRTSARDFLESRPVEAELEAIRKALDLAGETRCELHIVHVSCGAGVQLVSAARRRGVNVSCETCPHYLTLTQEDVVRLGAVAKCAPPLRGEAEQDQLWQHLLAGDIDTIGSDHSPCPPEMKRRASFFEIWGGISGAQHTLPLLLSEGFGRLSRLWPDEPAEGRAHFLGLVAGVLAGRVAARFKLPITKGRLAVGAEADLALVALDNVTEVQPEGLHHRHRQSPYLGRKLHGTILRTLLRGQTIFHEGKFPPRPAGRLVKPQL